MPKPVIQSKLRTATVQLKGTSPYKQSQHLQTVKPPRTNHDQFDADHWKERAHFDADGFVVIPEAAIKKCLVSATRYTPRVLKGSSTYAKLFERAVWVTKITPTAVHKDDLQCELVMVSSTGKKGAAGGAKVPRRYPRLEAGQWDVQITFTVADDRITEELFSTYLAESGLYIGIGMWRPETAGEHGRFHIDKVTWS